MTTKKTSKNTATTKNIDISPRNETMGATGVSQPSTDASQERANAGAEDAQRVEAKHEPVAEYVGEDAYSKHDTPHKLSLLERLDADNAKDAWSRPWVTGRMLDAPEPNPGMEQRWVRVSVHSDEDAANLTRQLNVGWLPRKADTIPKDFNLPTLSHGDFEGCVVVGGNMLCEMPAERTAARRDMIAKATRKSDLSVRGQLENDQANHNEHGGTGRIEDNSSTDNQLTRGRTPAVSPDE
jgi:hypothetical protein